MALPSLADAKLQPLMPEAFGSSDVPVVEPDKKEEPQLKIQPTVVETVQPQVVSPIAPQEIIAKDIQIAEKYLTGAGIVPRQSTTATPSVPSVPAMSWEDIWAYVLSKEGGYANNPLDPGGETKYGISKAAYPNLPISALTPDDAKAIFKTDYFDKVGGEELLKRNGGVAAHVADMAFNAGPTTAIYLLYDALGLPRKDTLTPELLDRLTPSEDAIGAYTKARLSYYSGLYNAPTFIKGWVNRVSDLNKALGTKSGLGGAYAAARDLDVEYLVQNQYGSYRNAQPRFRDLDSGERGYLRERERVLSPGYETALSLDPATINDRRISTLKEVFKASYDATYYTNTIAGLNELVNREAMKASELNRQALGDSFEKSALEKHSLGLYGGVLSIKDFEKELAKFKQDFPDIKLPVSDVKQVYEAAGKRAQLIEENYANLETGSFFDSIGNAAAKIGKVVFGYLPGTMLGSGADPYELGLMVGTGGQAKTLTEAAKLGAYAFLGSGALQPFVQSKRADLGLDAGFKQGLMNATSFGAGTAAFGALSVGLQNLWKLGSNSTAKAATKIADNVDEILTKQIPTPDTLYAKVEADGIRDLATIYKNNPYGGNYSSKILLETRMKDAAADMAQGKPVRFIKDDIKKFVGTDKRFISDVQTALRNSGPDGEILAEKFQKVSKFWDSYKKNQITRTIYSDIDDVPHSMVPITKPSGDDLYRFNTVDDARKFLNSKEAEGIISEHAVDIFPDPNGKGYFLGRAADLEPSSNLSGRMSGTDTEEGLVGSLSVRGFKDSDDLLIAKQYPEYTKVREFTPETIKNQPVVYPKRSDVAAAMEYEQQVKELMATPSLSKQGIPEERLIKRLELMEQEHINMGNKGPAMMDIGDTLGVEERISIRDFIDEIKEERAGLKGMMDCMVA